MWYHCSSFQHFLISSVLHYHTRWVHAISLTHSSIALMETGMTTEWEGPTARILPRLWTSSIPKGQRKNYVLLKRTSKGVLLKHFSFISYNICTFIFQSIIVLVCLTLLQGQNNSSRKVTMLYLKQENKWIFPIQQRFFIFSLASCFNVNRSLSGSVL